MRIARTANVDLILLMAVQELLIDFCKNDRLNHSKIIKGMEVE